ncbi:MAG: class I SAM-dependent methyltransferase [Planctomycetota bacterium]|nr:class I SAM-dependent methyltransferase [Planctomycetota bacterium]
MATISTDIWGEVYRDHHRGVRAPHTILRSDGRRETFKDAGIYFTAPRGPEEAKALEGLDGSILDAACGAGAYSLFLQERGAEVVSIDSSEGAIEVCRERGCRDARVRDVQAIELESGKFDAVLLMGFTLGLGKTYSDQVSIFRRLHKVTRSTGIIVGTTIDPLDTKDPGHLAYHEQNRQAGRPPGMIRLRVEYKGKMSPWLHVWMMTPQEVGKAALEAGWSIRSPDGKPVHGIYVLEKT